MHSVVKRPKKISNINPCDLILNICSFINDYCWRRQKFRLLSTRRISKVKTDVRQRGKSSRIKDNVKKRYLCLNKLSLRIEKAIVGNRIKHFFRAATDRKLFNIKISKQ